MAEKHHPADDNPLGGTMGTADHVKMWLAFWAGAKWSVVALAILGLLLLLFRTNDG